MASSDWQISFYIFRRRIHIERNLKLKNLHNVTSTQGNVDPLKVFTYEK